MNDFICNNFGNVESDIPKNLIDETTFMRKTCDKYHTYYTYLFCIILRILISILIYHSSYVKPVGIIIWCVIVILGFYSKCKLPNSTWKKYCRLIGIYSSIIVVNLSSIEIEQKKKISSSLMILDAMMGLKSRYSATI